MSGLKLSTIELPRFADTSRVSRRQLLDYSVGEKAQVVKHMPKRRRSPRLSKRRTASRSKGRGAKKPRLVKGRVNLRVSGYSGIQKISPSALIRYIPSTKIKLAAKRVLLKTKGKTKRGKGSRRVRRSSKKSRRRRSAGGGLKKRSRRKRKSKR